MSSHKNNKLQKLFQIWPIHTVASALWLNQEGYSRALLKKYVDSGWLSKYGHGAFMRKKDSVPWSGAVWGAQKTHNLFLGGKTALELHGKAHFVPFSDQRVFLFSKSSVIVPSWLKVRSEELNLVTQATDIFPVLTGHVQHSFGDYSLWVSNQAQAFLEYLYLTPKYHSYEEAYHLMENLHSMPGELMQEALKACGSIKIKRLALCLAKLQKAPWYDGLDRDKINLGEGERRHIQDGIWDPEYKIYYPSEWNKNELHLF